MKNIISVSRPTDIPAFHTDWFLKRLEEGCVYCYANSDKEKAGEFLKWNGLGFNHSP